MNPVSPNPPVRVLYHGNCFDGCASAAAFSVFYRQCIDPDASFEYKRLVHGQNGPLDPGIFGPHVNAIVDFRYAESPLLHFWVDHHRSAFYSAAARDHFHTRSGKNFVFDPSAPSCMGLLCRAFADRYGFDHRALQHLLTWAEIIDSASFDSAHQAVMLTHPALQLMMVLEGLNDPELEAEVIVRMQREEVSDIMRLQAIAAEFSRLWEQHNGTLSQIKNSALVQNRIVSFDLTETSLPGYNKFIPYYLFPEAIYTVGITRDTRRIKISVGSNPWRKVERHHNIARLCERYGGGGHEAVGAISLTYDELTKARTIVAEVKDHLSRPSDTTTGS